MMAPLTVVFFAIIGVVLAENLAYFAMHRGLTILLFASAGVVVASFEFYTSIRKVTQKEEKKVEILERQRNMVLELFGDTLEDLDNE